MNPQTLQAIAAIIAAYAALLGGLYAVVTRPLQARLDDLVSRVKAIEERLLGIENRITSIEKKVDALEIKAWR